MKNKFVLCLRKSMFLMFALSIFFLYPVLSIHATESFTVTEMSATATVGDSTLNVRSGPGKDYKALGTVSPGETLTVTGETDSWYRIDYSGKDGYVSTKYVTLSDSSDTAATVAENDPTDFADYEEGSAQTGTVFTISPKLILLIAIIALILIVMIVTIVMIKKSGGSDDDYNDDEYDDEDSDDEDDPDEEEDYEDDDEEEEEEKITVYKKPSKTKKNVVPYRKPSKKSASVPSPEEDYQLDIDPRIFKEIPDSKKTPATDKKAEDLDHAMKKLEELQKEIERIKNT